MHATRFAISILLCLLFASYGKAQELTAMDSLLLKQLDEVVVTATHRQLETIPVQRLEGEKLQLLSVHSVADAVRYFSGAQIKDYGGIGGLKTIDVRSMGSQHVGVFYDGVELGNAQNGVVDLGRFSLDNMEAISLYNGEKSALLQPAKGYASASSIYLQSRMPQFEADENPYRLQLSLRGGSFSTISPSILWEQQLTPHITSSLSSNYTYTAGDFPFTYSTTNGYDTTEIRQNGDVESLRLEWGLFGSLPRGEWRTKIYGYHSERGYPGAAVRDVPGVYQNEDRQWDDNLFVQGSFRQGFGEVYTLLLNTKYAYDYMRYLSDDVSTLYVDNTYHQQEIYLSAAHLFTLNSWWNVSTATDWQANFLDTNLSNFSPPFRNQIFTSAVSSMVLGGWRLQGTLLHTWVQDETQGAVSNNGSYLSPTAVLSYNPFTDIDLSLRAFYKKNFRLPTLNDLYYNELGNKSLLPEKAHQYDLGVTYKKEWRAGALRYLELRADGYFNQVTDKIIAMPTSNQFAWTMVNLGYVEIRGVEANLASMWQAGKVAIDTQLSYTYQQAQDLTDPTDSYYGGQIAYVPWHSGSAIVGLIYKDWNLNYSFIYTGERYTSSANITENYILSWYTSDLSLSRSLTLYSIPIRLTAEVNNLLDQSYEVVQWYPMPGINFMFKLDIQL